MIDIHKLKALADAATPGPWSADNSHHVGSINAADRHIGMASMYARRPNDITQNLANQDYIAAANPAAVLELIAEIERLQAEREEITDMYEKMQTGEGKMLHRVIEERDQSRAENQALRDGANFRAIQSLRQDCEALRKDAERYQWLRDNASLILDRKTAYQAETGFIKFDTMPARSETENAIDAAMGVEVDHG